MTVTKTELARLARVSRSLGHYAVDLGHGVTSTWERDYTCPVDYEARRREGERGVSHTFRVYDRPVFGQGRPFGREAQAVIKALAEHLDPDAEACSRVEAAR